MIFISCNYMVKSVCLYSGGLDSILAIQIIKNACKKKLEIIVVRFVTPFFDYKDELLFLEEKEYLKSKFDVVLKKFIYLKITLTYYINLNTGLEKI